MRSFTRFSRDLLTYTVLGGSLMFTGPATAKGWTTVRVATEGAYEPWNMTLPNGEIAGFEPELLKDLCARLKLVCTLQAQDWDGMIAGLNAGKFDMMMDAIMITPERQAVVDFSRPYAATQAVFVSTDPAMIANAPSDHTVKLSGDPTEDQATLAQLQALVKGKTIGIQSGTAYTDFIEKNFKSVATIRVYKTSGEHLMDLNAGRIDVAFDDVTFFSSALQNPENKAVHMVGPKLGGPIWGPGEALAFRKTDADLKAPFNEALSAALADGTVKRLAEKWFKADIAP
ncbi:transporter substrate-binding domain-containing protein [Pseudomonas typographi]|uniref:Transporter substrate-binding domain-containing protein n=1 Tax=Pseudomonas typographi TaxID=2715964 RepID=A0ABR7Z1T1_9PSED|nr:transporter substrate-binding domain-containing protein [Pseudomonas typographi]MBD1551648.1 transporter substrate-binding domain-containing protein [Pseudomonas typographi]MBD1587098.1 transporter substrate-binding domain-containing protein [Pseudomonas typographi]MBD1599334.1 transporter substrate-binding domain-containing protein [Pseudomonas typographi]